MKFKADEIASVLQQEIEQYQSQIDVREVGRVLEVGDGIARVYGLSGVMAGEMVEFPNGTIGLAFTARAMKPAIAPMTIIEMTKPITMTPRRGPHVTRPAFPASSNANGPPGIDQVPVARARQPWHQPPVAPQSGDLQQLLPRRVGADRPGDSVVTPPWRNPRSPAPTPGGRPVGIRSKRPRVRPAQPVGHPVQGLGQMRLVGALGQHPRH